MNNELIFNKNIFVLTTCIRCHLMLGHDYWYIITKEKIRMVDNKSKAAINDEVLTKYYTEARQAIGWKQIKNIFDTKFAYMFERIGCRQTRVKLEKGEVGYRLYKEKMDCFVRLLNQYRENYCAVDNSLLLLEKEILTGYGLNAKKQLKKETLDMENLVVELVQKEMIEMYRKLSKLEAPLFDSYQRMFKKLFAEFDSCQKTLIVANERLSQIEKQQIKQHSEFVCLSGKQKMIEEKLDGWVSAINNFEQKVIKLFEKLMSGDTEIKTGQKCIEEIKKEIKIIKENVSKLFHRLAPDHDLSLKERVEKEFDLSWKGDSELLNIVKQKHNM